MPIALMRHQLFAPHDLFAAPIRPPPADCQKNATVLLQELKEAMRLLDMAEAAARQQLPTKENAAPQRRVIYHKTHKTGSSTVGSILYRHAARNDLVLFKLPNKGHEIEMTSRNPSTTPADMTLYHFIDHCNCSWVDMRAWYEHAVPGGMLVTVVREPVSHYVSRFYYYEEVKLDITLQSYAEDGRGANTLAADFAITTQQQLDEFLEVSRRKSGPVLVGQDLRRQLVEK